MITIFTYLMQLIKKQLLWKFQIIWTVFALKSKKCPKISNKTPQKCFWQHLHTLEILMNSPVVKLWQRLQFPKTSDSIQVDDDLLAFVSSTNLVSELKLIRLQISIMVHHNKDFQYVIEMLINFNAWTARYLLNHTC